MNLSNTTVIYGPPGTGKTTTLLHLIELALSGGTQPDEIAFVSFTRAARREAKMRAMRKFDLTEADLPWFRTLHSTGLTLLGYDKSSIISYRHMKEFCNERGYKLTLTYSSDDGDEINQPAVQTNDDKLRAAYEWGRHRLLSLDQTMSQCPDPVPTGLFKAYVTDYEKFKLEKGLIDFHDMLEMGLKIDGPPVSIAFIDEAQDLTPLQIAAVERWFKDCDEIIIAGDDDQCIYKWSGAEPEWLIGLKDKAGDHEILSQSYRVPGMAHAIANRIITRNKQRVEKIYKPMSKRGAVMMGNKIKAIDQIKKTIADKRNRVFVLVRNRFLIPQWSSPLMREAIPFSVEGKGSGGPLGKPKLCSCAMACNRLLEGGDITATEWRSILDYIPASMPYMIKGVKVRSKKNQNSLSLDELKIHWGLKDFADYLEKHGPTSVLTKNTQPEQRIYLAQLIQAGYDLVKAQKYPPVRITTIHGSKGREANLVIIVPDMARLTWNEYVTNEEAENRVAYVAVTRTKWALFFVQRETQMYYPYEDYLHQKKEAEANKKEGDLWGV